MITFDPLWRTLKSRDLNKGDLQKLTKLSSTTIAKLSKNEPVMLDVVDRIATALKVPIYDVVEVTSSSENSDSKIPPPSGDRGLRHG